MKMTCRAEVVSAIALVLLAGCVPSLHPLYSEDIIVFDERLLGSWGEVDDEIWEFALRGTNAYQLTVNKGQEDESVFQVTMLELNDRRYLDLYPAGSLPQADFYELHLFPTHTFMRVDELGDSLKLAFFSPEWIGELIEANTNAVRHEMAGDRILLTASTEALQKLVREHTDDEDMFEKAEDALPRLTREPEKKEPE
jgi:hypothetical protein